MQNIKHTSISAELMKYVYEISNTCSTDSCNINNNFPCGIFNILLKINTLFESTESERWAYLNKIHNMKVSSDMPHFSSNQIIVHKAYMYVK